MSRSKKPKKLNILFIHASCPGQFSELCEHLNTSGLANGYYMTTPGNRNRNLRKYQNLLAFEPHGSITDKNAYYYSGKVERGGRISFGLFNELQERLKKLRIDLIVAHGSFGSPHFLFDEFDIPIITYIEFPSYADHGWDSRYPPMQDQRLTDKNMQMLSYYETVKSTVTLVPTEYAKSMFPEALRERIVAQFEGIPPKNLEMREDSGIRFPEGKRTLGFAARDLSSAKGLESFLQTAKYLIETDANIHFVVIGDPTSTTYGYERNFLDRKYGKEKEVTFADHLVRQLELDLSHFSFTGKLPYKEFSDILHRIDLFMYPVMFGSGNWGLIELLARGRPVVSIDRCYVSEIIQDSVNGVLVSEDTPEEWAKTVMALLSDKDQRDAIGSNAMELSKQFYLPAVAEQYMAIFEDAIQQYKTT